MKLSTLTADCPVLCSQPPVMSPSVEGCTLNPASARQILKSLLYCNPRPLALSCQNCMASRPPSILITGFAYGQASDSPSGASSSDSVPLPPKMFSKLRKFRSALTLSTQVSPSSDLSQIFTFDSHCSVSSQHLTIEIQAMVFSPQDLSFSLAV